MMKIRTTKQIVYKILNRYTEELANRFFAARGVKHSFSPLTPAEVEILNIIFQAFLKEEKQKTPPGNDSTNLFNWPLSLDFVLTNEPCLAGIRIRIDPEWERKNVLFLDI